MSTTLAKPGQIERKWYILDAAGKPLGRVAAKAAVLLRGKDKVIFTEGAAAVRQVTVTAPHIRSLAFKVNSGTEGKEEPRKGSIAASAAV